MTKIGPKMPIFWPMLGPKWVLEANLKISLRNFAQTAAKKISAKKSCWKCENPGLEKSLFDS